MAELVDAPGSGPGEAIHRSSSLLSGIENTLYFAECFFILNCYIYVFTIYIFKI